MYILNSDFVRKVNITTKNLRLTEDVLVVMEKRVTPYGNGAKIDCVKEYIGRRAYVVIVKN
jgi:putative transposon-encoded protein